MTTTQPNESQPKNRRMLAAIMFSDVVGFSVRMGEHEMRTAALVQRDLDFMSRKCERRSGHVIKTTGDGLLVIFDSAVEAVGAAIDIQAAMADAAKKLPAEQVLQHRIAIHLGDIIFADDDVMGDGVNIAARLQALADPGGVCISEATYEVVKNRLKFEAVYVGPQELKNIDERIAIYRITPAPGSTAEGVAAEHQEQAGRRSVTPWAIGLTVMALAVIAAVIAGRSASAKRAAAPDANPQASPIAETRTAPEVNVAAPTTPPPPAGADFIVVREHFAERYDFGGLAAYLLTHPELLEDGSKRPRLVDRYQRLDKYMANFRRDLKQYSAQAPLILPANSVHPELHVWMDEQNVLYMGPPGEPRRQWLEDLEPRVMLPILARTMWLTHGPRGKLAPREMVNETVTSVAQEFGISGAAAKAIVQRVIESLP